MIMFMSKLKRLMTMAFVSISACAYILLTNNTSKETGYHHIKQSPQTQLQSLSNDDKCMDNFDFHIVNQSATDSNKMHPIKFLPNLRNPCWFEFYDQRDVDRITNSTYNRRVVHSHQVKEPFQLLKKTMDQRLKSMSWRRNIRLRCLPFFIIIGVAKSSTTDLYSKLRAHPQVKMSILKEPHWYTRSVNTTRFLYANPQPITFEEYLDANGLAAIGIEKQLEDNHCNIKHASKSRFSIIGEGSIYTFTDASWRPKSSVYGQTFHEQENTPKYLKWILPQTKVIVILREPVSRLLSDYLFYNKTENGNVSAADFHHKVVNSIIFFKECVERHGEHFCINDEEHLQRYPLHIIRGLYSLFMKHWMAEYSREDILVLKTEDYSANVIQTLRTIFKFLDLDDLTKEQEDIIKMKEIRNKATKSIGEMWKSTKKLLKDFYQPYNIKLAKLLQDERFLWT